MDKDKIRASAKEYIRQEANPGFRAEVEQLLSQENWDELSDRFYTDIEFGTGGLRGVIAGGYNRMNSFVIRRATQGLASYVVKHGVAGPDGVLGAVIAHDSRHFSDEFALQAALVLCAHGIRTYLFPSLRPTPELSFAVRKLGAATGIVVTASHNPAQYNGYKVYWNDGSQVVPPHDKGIIAEVRGVSGEIRTLDRDEGDRRCVCCSCTRSVTASRAHQAAGEGSEDRLHSAARHRGRNG